MPRPSKYCPATAAKIISAVHGGDAIEAACQRVGVKRTTFLSQIERYNFRAVLDQAKAAGRAANAKRAAKQDPVSGAEMKSRRATRTPRPEAAQPTQPVQAKEKPEVRGECVWSANDAALAVIVNIVGAVVDGLRADLRSRGFKV